MQELQIFDNTEFGQMRTLTIEGKPWFVGKDVAEALGYRDTSDALKKHVSDEDKLTRHFADSGQNREMYIINESGLYALIFSSKQERANKFKHWVTAEVLPSIRTTGAYSLPKGQELIALAVIEAQKVINAQNEQIAEMKPKALFADAVSASNSSILVGDLAKLICQNGFEIGQKRLFRWLRDNGYLIKRSGSDWNMPTQRSMEQGLFEIKESHCFNPDGSIRITRTPKVTGKGQVYFVHKFLGDNL